MRVMTWQSLLLSQWHYLRGEHYPSDPAQTMSSCPRSVATSRHVLESHTRTCGG